MSQPRFPGRQSLLKVNRTATQLLPVMTRQMTRQIPPLTVTCPAPAPIDPSLPLRGRPPKRLKMEQLSVGLRHQQGSSFIMKLFDRSVDLARFEGDSPLYPVCRAWMLNKPRTRSDPTCNSNEKHQPLGAESSRQSMPDIVERFNRKEIDEIANMPKPSETDTHPFLLEKPFPKDNSDPKLDDLEGSAARSEALLKHHKARWTKVRRNWQRHRRNYGRKYQLSYDLLDAIIMKQV
ncbi:protein lin-37 homolog [Ochlerotatus camptorhynchus]|uniref:protein lin-37 homolog n=1 Tax=Ochlerotatus camptorhynchus TaxID=644619 RepID=UPI0031DC98BE